MSAGPSKSALRSSSSTDRVLVESHRSSHASKSALVAILKSVQEHGLPTNLSRQSVKRARNRELNATTPLGNLFIDINLDLKNGSTRSVPILNPAALLWAECKKCVAFGTFLQKAISECHNYMSIALYTDEVLPGNPLKGLNQRKLWAFYWSFLDFQQNLGCEELWLHVACIRSSILKQVSGGVTQVFEKIVKTFYRASYDFRYGLPLEIDGATVLLRAQITCIVGDEAALKSCWSFKGASGIVPCVQCTNCVSDASDLQRRSGNLFTTSTPHLNKCVPNDDQKFLELVKHLDSEKPNRTQKQFEQLEKAFGITLLEGMAQRVESLLHLGIGPCSTLMYDWMHVYLVNGVWNSEVGWLLDHLRDPELATWVADLTFPGSVKGRSVTGVHVLEKRAWNSGSISCSASEGLSLYQVLRGYLMTLPPAQKQQLQVQSYFALSEVVDILTKSRFEIVDPSDVSNAIEKHLNIRLHAYPNSTPVPKCHFALHLGPQCRHHKWLRSCWVHERKHKEVKREGGAMMNANVSVGFEACVHLERFFVIIWTSTMSFISGF